MAGFSAFAALAAAALVGAAVSTVLALICLGLGICIFLYLLGRAVWNRRRAAARLPGKRAPGAFLLSLGVLLFTAALLLFSFVRAWNKNLLPVMDLVGQKVKIHGTILDDPEQAYGRSYYLVKVTRVSEESGSQELPVFTMRLSTRLPFVCQPCDMLECTVTFTAFDDSGGLYSSRNSRLADGVALGGYISDYAGVSVISNRELPPQKIAALLRRILGRSFEKRLPAEEAGLIRAMLLGQRGYVSDQDYGNFKQIGASHLLVISGLHIAAIAAFFSLPLGRVGRKLRAFLSALGILGFLLLIGFQVSAVRGGLMILVYLVGNALGRKPDSLNSLGFAVLVICLVNPFSGMDLGFALSVFSTLGILLLSRRLSLFLLRSAASFPRLRRALTPVADSLSATLSALLFTLPIQAAVFSGITLLAPLATLVLILPCTLLLYVSISAAFLGLIPLPGLAEPFFFCAGWLARLALAAADWLASLPGTFLELTSPVSLTALAGILLLLCLAPLFRHNRKGRERGVCVLLAGAVILCAGGCTVKEVLTQDSLVFMTASDSSCVAMIQNGRAVVLSLGGYQTGAAKELLLRRNVQTIDLLCLPVRDSDAREAAADLLETFDVARVALPENAYWGQDLLTAASREEHLCLRNGDSLPILDGAVLTVSHEMHRLTLAFGSAEVIVETAATGVGSCQLLFTTETNSSINSAFTVLQNDDIIETSSFTKLPPGQYITAGGQGLSIQLFRDGRLKIG